MGACPEGWVKRKAGLKSHGRGRINRVLLTMSVWV